MQIDAINRYQTTLAQVAAMRTGVARAAKLIQAVGGRLKTSPLKLMVINNPSDVAYPASLMGGGEPLRFDGIRSHTGCFLFEELCEDIIEFAGDHQPAESAEFEPMARYVSISYASIGTTF